MADEPVQVQMQRAVELHRAGRITEAAAAYESVLSRDSDNADALHLLGLVRHQAGDSDAGIELIRRAIALNPGAPDFHANLAGVFATRQRWGDAADAVRRALDLRPGDAALRRRLAQYLKHLGVELLAKDRPVDAVAALERSVELRPDAADALGNLGLALARVKRYADAADRYRQALAIEPDVAEIHTNLGAALLALGDAAGGVAAHRRACALRPDWPAAMSNLAIALAQLGQTDEALSLHEAVLRTDPDDATSLFNRGVIRLSRGDFAGGWRDYEARFRVPELKGQRTFPQPRWTGQEPIAGRTVLVHAEQGLGDTIQFVRYVPQLAARGARVILLCDPLLERLMRHSFPEIEVLARDQDLQPFDLHVPVMSLPFAFGTTVETVPAKMPYLVIPPESGAAMTGRIASEGLRVGLVWAGNPGHYNDRNRSITLSHLLEHLPARSELHFYSLQKGPGAGQLNSASGVTDLAPHFRDLADTAAAISMLDLGISVDTSIAHLAGALAAEVWTLLPEPADFRWMLARDDSPWYPTMRQFRQGADRRWEPVLERVAAELVRRVGGG